MVATVSPLAYWTSAAAAAVACVALCVAARHHPGRWTVRVARVIGLLLAADAISYTVGLVVQGTWSATTDLHSPSATWGWWWRRWPAGGGPRCWWR